MDLNEPQRAMVHIPLVLAMVVVSPAVTKRSLPSSGVQCCVNTAATAGWCGPCRAHGNACAAQVERQPAFGSLIQLECLLEVGRTCHALVALGRLLAYMSRMHVFPQEPGASVSNI